MTVFNGDILNKQDRIWARLGARYAALGSRRLFGVIALNAHTAVVICLVKGHIIVFILLGKLWVGLPTTLSP